MSALFDRLLASAERAVDRTFAEAWSFEPRREVRNANSVPDASRDPFSSFSGVYSDAAEDQPVGGQGGADRVTSQPTLSILYGQGPAIISRGDRFTRLATGTLYEATSALPDALSRTVVRLKELTP